MQITESELRSLIKKQVTERLMNEAKTNKMQLNEDENNRTITNVALKGKMITLVFNDEGSTGEMTFDITDTDAINNGGKSYVYKVTELGVCGYSNRKIEYVSLWGFSSSNADKLVEFNYAAQGWKFLDAAHDYNFKLSDEALKVYNNISNYGGKLTYKLTFTNKSVDPQTKKEVTTNNDVTVYIENGTDIKDKTKTYIIDTSLPGGGKLSDDTEPYTGVTANTESNTGVTANTESNTGVTTNGKATTAEQVFAEIKKLPNVKTLGWLAAARAQNGQNGWTNEVIANYRKIINDYYAAQKKQTAQAATTQAATTGTEATAAQTETGASKPLEESKQIQQLKKLIKEAVRKELKRK